MDTVTALGSAALSAHAKRIGYLKQKSQPFTQLNAEEGQDNQKSRSSSVPADTRFRTAALRIEARFLRDFWRIEKQVEKVYNHIRASRLKFARAR